MAGSAGDANGAVLLEEEGHMWAARGDQEPTMLRDVIEAIARDELDYVAANSQKALAL